MSLRRRARWALNRARFPFKRQLVGLGWSVYERSQGAGKRVAESERGDPGGLPVPPRRLRVRNVADHDVEFFLRSGRANFEQIGEMLHRTEVDSTSLGAVLDFGCGCGRVARWWPTVAGPRVSGCDYDSELVEWCKQNLPFEFQPNALEPPLPYEDDAFDLVYALSVFTHLPVELQDAWIRELERVLRPGGHLWLTVAGESHLDRLDGDGRRAFARGEPVTQFGEVPGSNLCAAFHPPAYVTGTLLAGFELVATEPGPRSGPGTTLAQDAYLARLG